jgi:ketosteroid isomerase-like protein
MTDWYEGMFAKVDEGDLEGYLEGVDDDAVLYFANEDAKVGKQAIRETFSGLIDALEGMTHYWEHAYENGDTTALEGKIAYHRKDGHTIKLPVVTVLQRNGDGLVDELRVYMDSAPTFAPVA